MPVPDHYSTTGGGSSSVDEFPTYSADLQYVQSMVLQIYQIANEDVEMQAPTSERTRLLVIDTNVLLDHLEVLKQFVEDVEKYCLPVIIVIPGIVIQELDGQKKGGQGRGDERRAKLARHASTWLLAEIRKKQCGIVKGQANNETCKSSGTWKLWEAEVVRTNDELILDCCQYYFQQQLQTYLCTSDVNLRIAAEIAERDGPLQTMAPPSGQTWSSMAIAAVIFENEHDVLGTLKWRKAGSKSHSHNKGVLQVPDDNSMDVDENLPLCLPPSHPLDQLHEQVVAEFTKLLGKLVLQVGGQEIHSAAESMYAPEWRQKPFSEWTPDLCLKYLNSLRKVKASSPDVGVFLTLPRSRSGISGRRGQDWSREAWDEIIKYLTRLGVIWDYSVIQETVKELEFKVERVFAMKMRPTGT